MSGNIQKCMKAALLRDDLTCFGPWMGSNWPAFRSSFQFCWFYVPQMWLILPALGWGWGWVEGRGRCHVSVREKSPPKHLHSRCVMLYGQTDKHKRWAEETKAAIERRAVSRRFQPIWAPSCSLQPGSLLFSPFLLSPAFTAGSPPILPLPSLGGENA